MVAVLFGIILVLVFKPWISFSGTLSAGDWPYLYAEHIRNFTWTPGAMFVWLAPYYQIVTKLVVGTLGLQWHIVERVLWYWLWVVLSVYSSFRFTRSFVGALIYTTNTYALMLVGGGQMGVAMAYALAPLVFDRFTAVPTQKTARLINIFFLNGIILAVQAMFDPRITLLTVVACAFYWLFTGEMKRSRALPWFLIPIGLTVVVHTYWWVAYLRNPSVLSLQIGQATSEAVQYLSFATFSNTLSLLHPNWPENIFGKVYFQRPEFLIIPALSFIAVFVGRLRWYVLLSLVGAFLAKGANPPFGGMYLWLFEYVPGFWMFRDATKFYLYIALAYSVLVPAALGYVSEKVAAAVKGKAKKYMHTAVLFVFFVFWSWTIREAILGKLSGTFVSVTVSPEYEQVPRDSVAWYPRPSRFSMTGSSYDPSVSTSYIVVPDDVRGEIFVTDRMYDPAKREEAIQYVATMSGSRRIRRFTDLAVFEVTQ